MMTLVRRHQKLVMHARSPRVIAPQAHDLRVEVEGEEGPGAGL